ncbi:hypothetical protein IFM89_034096 [Coptis chinensis]|uniref:Uncharacterized protein n=1 Tax=Coptis chinensis TaxID=261450 RepID=A0A835GZD1_9MAGN|nr:hypothetical protein IFM89_034096 [Coptis chinensis]
MMSTKYSVLWASCKISAKKDLHLEWVAHEDYIPLLIKLLGAKNREIMQKALVILSILAKDSDDTKERIANVEDAIKSIVCALRRWEGKLAVALLLELSKNAAICERVGKLLDCIYFLVVMSSNDDVEASRDANELLENLALLDQNIAQMAKANYFKPLLQCLSLVSFHTFSY